jgi:kynurenine 3-monooxygenase
MKCIIFLVSAALKLPLSLGFAPLKQARRRPTISSTSLHANNEDGPLKVAIIGAGPSGLLLAHRLLLSSLPVASLDIYESRSDPRLASNLDGRAYALGLGVRGRTAIKSAGEELWESVKSRGFECDRFRLHINEKINVKLRDAEVGVEPSVLIYQTDLCGALLDELDKRSKDSSIDVRVQFNANATDLDLTTSQITIGDHTHDTHYDLIVGSDGANSVVRASLTTYSTPFAATQRKLPGYFKVARVAEMPPKMDPSSVALVLPRKGTVTAFVEPTIGGGGCVLFACMSLKSPADPNEIDLGAALFGEASVTTDQVEDMINEAYPLFEGTPGLSESVQTLLSQRNGVADSVKCNIYHSKADVTPTVIIGDAAHATGGVSGQGCNSALMDSKVLSDCIAEYCSMQGSKKAKLHECLKSYSMQQVPEGLALYDLSFGNDGKTLPIFRSIASMLSTVIDSLFRGRWGIGKKPLQTLLASSSTSFVDIRREREKYFVKDFPSDEELVGMLDQVYK